MIHFYFNLLTQKVFLVIKYKPLKILKVCTLDQLHENTYTKKQEERKAFVNQIKRIAQKEGLIKHIIEEVNPKFIELMMDFLLSNKKEHTPTI